MAALDKLLTETERDKVAFRGRLERIARDRDGLDAEEARTHREIADCIAVILYCHGEQFRLLRKGMADVITEGAEALRIAVEEAKARADDKR